MKATLLIICIVCLLCVVSLLCHLIVVEFKIPKKVHNKFSCKIRHKYPKGFKGYCTYVLDQDWSRDPDTLKLYLHLVRIVKVVDSCTEGVVVRKGECLVDIEDLFEEIGMLKHIARSAMFDLMQARAIEHVKFINETRIIVKLPDFLEEEGGEA